MSHPAIVIFHFFDLLTLALDNVKSI
jgi:hypothetical protein